MGSKAGDHTGGAESTLEAGKHIVAHDCDRAGAASGDHHGEFSEHESEARLAAEPIPRAKAHTVLKDTDEVNIADRPLK